MINRRAEDTLKVLSREYPVVAITGPRQSGKTTLARHVFGKKPYVSLEEPDVREFANEDPRGFMSRYQDGAVLDEVQHCPSLFSYIQSRVDRDKKMGLFVLTGSQQFGMLSKITQTLAGRIGMLQLLPFSLAELKDAVRAPEGIDQLLFKGLYPPIYDRNVSPSRWYANYILTYVERDVRQMINVRDLNTFQRFIRMCAARTGQMLNLSGLANDCGITHNTARAWISILEASYVIFLLRPHHRNFNKRLVKTPKLYFYDTGLAAWLLGIQDPDQLSLHPMRSALFESLVVSELQKGRYNRGMASNLYFWRDSSGNEVDLIVEQGKLLMPIEIKSGQTITQDYFTGLRKWLSIAQKESDHPILIYSGGEGQQRAGIEVLPWQELTRLSEKI